MKHKGSNMPCPNPLPSDWEKKVDAILQLNNDRLVERLQHSIGRISVSDVLTGVTTDSEMDPHTRISTGAALGRISEASTYPASEPRFSQKSEDADAISSGRPSQVEIPEIPTRSSSRSGSKERGKNGKRVSMTSLTSEEESQHVARLKTTQLARKGREELLGKTTSSIFSQQTMLAAIRKIVASWFFEAFFAFAILSNSIFIGVEVHYAAHNAGKLLPSAFVYVDQTYAAVFLTELVLRVLSEGKPFFWSSPNVAWNYLDVLINITSVLNLVSYLSSMGQDTDSDTFKASGNVRIIRILRLTRVIRVVRIVKIVRFIRALRSLVHSIFGTMKVLLWSVLLLFMIMYVFAIVFTDVSNEYSNGFQEINEESLAFLRKYFFDLERSVNTLFQSICNGLNWGDVADKLNELSRVWGYLYVIFVAFCLFAVLNVMTGMFCQSAIESAERDQEMHIQNVMNNKQQQVEMFMSIFNMLQQDRGRRATGNITFMEFEQLFDRREIRAFFEALDVEAKDAWTLFKLMDVSGNGDLDASEFVDGCMRLKGPARSIDVSLLLQEQRRLRKKISSMEQMLLERFERPSSKRPSCSLPESEAEDVKYVEM